MRQALLDQLRPISPEERAILEGNETIQRELYTAQKDFVVDSRKMLQTGKLIQLRRHTRFARFPKHRHNYVEMVYMCSGTTTHLLSGGKRVVLEEGDLLVLNQTVYHEILPAGAGDIAVNFIILPEFFDRTLVMLEQENFLRDFLISALAGGDAQHPYLLFHGKGIVPVENLLESMIWTLLQGISGVNTLNATSMGLLFLNLSSFSQSLRLDASGQPEQSAAFRVLGYIESHYKSGTLAEISGLLDLPTYTVSRLLKKHTGSNFKELLQQRKLQQAAYLLTNTPITVDAVMTSVGYDNSSFFFRKFREKYGCSPAEYRREKGLMESDRRR